MLTVEVSSLSMTPPVKITLSSSSIEQAPLKYKVSIIKAAYLEIYLVFNPTVLTMFCSAYQNSEQIVHLYSVVQMWLVCHNIHWRIYHQAALLLLVRSMKNGGIWVNSNYRILSMNHFEILNRLECCWKHLLFHLGWLMDLRCIWRTGHMRAFVYHTSKFSIG